MDALPRSLIALVWVWELVLLGSARLAWRLYRERVLGGSGAREVRTLVIGADHAAAGLVQEMRRNRSGEEWLQPVGFVDADPRLTGHLIEGLRVHGTIADLARVLRELEPEAAVVAVPALPGRWMREVVEACHTAGVRLKTVPAMRSPTWRACCGSSSRRPPWSPCPRYPGAGCARWWRRATPRA